MLLVSRLPTTTWFLRSTRLLFGLRLRDITRWWLRRRRRVFRCLGQSQFQFCNPLGQLFNLRSLGRNGLSQFSNKLVSTVHPQTVQNTQKLCSINFFRERLRKELGLTNERLKPLAKKRDLDKQKRTQVVPFLTAKMFVLAAALVPFLTAISISTLPDCSNSIAWSFGSLNPRSLVHLTSIVRFESLRMTRALPPKLANSLAKNAETFSENAALPTSAGLSPMRSRSKASYYNENECS